MHAVELADAPKASVLREPVVPSGRNLDDALDFDFDIDADGALELDCLPSTQSPRVETPRWSRLERPSSTSMKAVRPSSTSMKAVRPSSTSVAAVDTHAGLVAFAGFGEAPTSFWAAPAYAVRVIKRRRAMKKELARARLSRSQDVGLYEASLRTADDGAVRNGLIVIAMLIAMTLVAAAVVVRVVAGLLSVRG